MFKKKKLYKIVYELYATYTTIIEAKDEEGCTDKCLEMLKKICGNTNEKQ